MVRTRVLNISIMGNCTELRSYPYSQNSKTQKKYYKQGQKTRRKSHFGGWVAITRDVVIGTLRRRG